MKKTKSTRRSLVIGHLEGISRSAIKRYPDIVTEFARHKSGVYSLYKDNALYYVGLAKNLRSRLHDHLRDRHADEWDHFNVYLTQGDEHQKELESLVLRIASPKGNRAAGRFPSSQDLRRMFRLRIVEEQRRELADITLKEPPPVSPRSADRRKRGEYDTIICPAHLDGFEKEFLGRNRWYAIRISKNVIPRLKYVAIYLTSPAHRITHYGRIRSIKPWRDSGKYMVLLKEKPKHIGPISHSSKVNMQSCRLALMARLKRARTLAEVL